MNLERHSGKCSVCQHPEQSAIEADYLRWQTVESIREKYDLPGNALNRHVKAFPQLKESRERNIGSVANWILEKGQKADIEVTPALMAAAMNTAAKIHGLFIDRTLDLTRSLESASDAELDFFELHGRLPAPGELAPEPEEEQ